MLVPRALRPGDTIALVAPSSPFEAVLGFRGLGFLATRYKLLFDRELFSRTGYLAGDDARREAELRRALETPGVAAVLAARGGYGASRFVHTRIDWSILREQPRWIVGFSDITALHVEAARAGVASMHAPHLTSLGRSDHATRQSVVSALEAPLASRAFVGLGVLRSGTARGPLFGGNLTLLHACAAAGRLSIPEGAILFIEDVTERPYRIDRMLATLRVGGHFSRLGGVVVGEFTACDPGPDRVTTRDVLETHLGSLGVPVLDGLPAGHGLRNEPLVLGAEVALDASGTTGSLRVGDDAAQR